MSTSQTLKTYRPVFVFIGKFAGIYILLTGLYRYYLSLYSHQTDPLTRTVGKSVDFLFKITGINASTPPLEQEHGLKLIINNEYVARIVEGCTAMSVIIMFVAFILAFSPSIKKSLTFAIAGSLLIFVFNIIRIAVLGYMLYAYPEYQDFSHRIIFPALIYGFVVLLWIYYLQKNEKGKS